MGVTHIPNPTYAIAIATSSQAALQASITHHWIMPNNLNPVPTLINLSPQQLIVATASNLPTIDARAFADLVGEFFRVLELLFAIKNLNFFL